MMQQPKPFPQDNPDTENCKLCGIEKFHETLTEGFCPECLTSGSVEGCSYCQRKFFVDELNEVRDGSKVCEVCYAEAFSDEGQYHGPRSDYYSSPAETY